MILVLTSRSGKSCYNRFDAFYWPKWTQATHFPDVAEPPSFRHLYSKDVGDGDRDYGHMDILDLDSRLEVHLHRGLCPQDYHDPCLTHHTPFTQCSSPAHITRCTVKLPYLHFVLFITSITLCSFTSLSPSAYLQTLFLRHPVNTPW